MATVDIDPKLLDSLKSFRMKKHSGNAAVVVKIDKAKLLMHLDETIDDVGEDLAELEEELPENTPRFIVLSYKLTHKDGRVSFPLVLLHWAPPTSSLELSTLYASALSNFSVQSDVAKVVDLRDGTLDRDEIEKKLGGGH